jgi:hypothetical protein
MQSRTRELLGLLLLTLSVKWMAAAKGFGVGQA